MSIMAWKIMRRMPTPFLVVVLFFLLADIVRA